MHFCLAMQFFAVAGRSVASSLLLPFVGSTKCGLRSLRIKKSHLYKLFSKVSNLRRRPLVQITPDFLFKKFVAFVENSAMMQRLLTASFHFLCIMMSQGRKWQKIERTCFFGPGHLELVLCRYSCLTSSCELFEKKKQVIKRRRATEALYKTKILR